MSHVLFASGATRVGARQSASAPLIRMVGMLAAAGLALLAGGSARAEDFDCDKARLAAEKTVCAHDYLRRLDDRTAALYGLLWGRLDTDSREGLRDHQLAFLDTRNACGASERCVTAHRSASSPSSSRAIQ